MFSVNLKLNEEEKVYYVCDKGEAVQTMPFNSFNTLLLDNNIRVRDWDVSEHGVVVMFENVKPILIEQSEYMRVSSKFCDPDRPFLQFVPLSQSEYNDLFELFKSQNPEEFNELDIIHQEIYAITSKVKKKPVIK